jgi:hypothetical protein
MVLNSLLQEKLPGCFSWRAGFLEVCVYYESFSPIEGGAPISLGWRGYVWPANINPWAGHYLFQTYGRSKGEVTVALEGFLLERFPGVLPNPPPTTLERVFSEEDPF